MATLKPFRGWRYRPAAVGDLADVVAPPYDVIDPSMQAALYERSPHNVVRLILSRAADPYGDAARTLAGWRSSGVLAPDPAPALYLYAQAFALPDGTRTERVGLIGALRLAAFESGQVRPHERTLDAAKRDRLALVRACRTSLSPIFGLVAAPGLRCRDFMPDGAADVDVTDRAGVRHRLWRLGDAATIAAIEAQLADHEVFIADGHHRYETALTYRDEVRATNGVPPDGTVPADYVMAYLTTMEDPGLVVLPTHRVLRDGALAAPALRARLGAQFTIEDLPWSRVGLDDLLARLGPIAGARGTTRIGAAAAGADRLWLLSAPTEALAFAAEVAPELRALDVSVLHQIVLGDALGLGVGASGGAPGLEYTQDAARAFARVAAGEAAAAFFLPPTDVRALQRIALAGLTMPEKSTYFHPKLLTGLVFYSLEEDPAGR